MALVYVLLVPWGCSIDSRVPVECEQVHGVCISARGDAGGTAPEPGSSPRGNDAGRDSGSTAATQADASGTQVQSTLGSDEQTLPQSDTAIEAGTTDATGLESEPQTSESQPDKTPDGAAPDPTPVGDAGPPTACESNPECAARFSELVAGNSFTCGLTTDGAIRCWGFSPDHPINTFPATIPKGKFLGLAAADSYLCGIDEDARLSCWGLPNSTTAFSPEGSFVQVAAGEGGICAVGTNTELSCWMPSGAALPPAFGDGFTRVAVGPYQACGLLTDESLVCWDLSGAGAVPTPAGSFRAVAVGATQACAITTDGELSCWDTDGVARMGVPTGDFEQVALSPYGGSERACAVRADGTAECWGSGGGGVPTVVRGEYVGLTVGAAHVCLLLADQTATCAMSNYEDEHWGQTTPPSYAPECGAYSDVRLGDTYLLRDIGAVLPRACAQAPWAGATRVSVQSALGVVDAPGYDEYPDRAPPGAFPSVVWGLHEGQFAGAYQEPVALSELGSLLANWTWRVPTSSEAAFAVVYEITVGPDPASAEGSLPIELWLYSRKVSQPLLEPEYAVEVSDSPWTVVRSAPDAATASLIYYNTYDDFGNCDFCDGVSTLSLSAFVRDAVNRELALDSWYLLGVRAGFKVWQASADDVFRFDVFDLKQQ